MWTIFKVFIECVAVLLMFYVSFLFVFWPRGMRDLSFLIRDQTHIPCFKRRSLNHWTTREVLYIFLQVTFLTEGASYIELPSKSVHGGFSVVA